MQPDLDEAEKAIDAMLEETEGWDDIEPSELDPDAVASFVYGDDPPPPETFRTKQEHDA